LPDTAEPASVKFRSLNGRSSRWEEVVENHSRPIPGIDRPELVTLKQRFPMSLSMS
jgi:hypothetical protein